jgi:hypothetical protein
MSRSRGNPLSNRRKLDMPEPERIEPDLPTKPPVAVRILGSLLLVFSVGLVSCQAMFTL